MQCLICKEPIKQKQLANLKCNHHFHKKCLKKWISINPNCPYCKKLILDEFNIIIENQYCKNYSAILKLNSDSITINSNNLNLFNILIRKIKGFSNNKKYIYIYYLNSQNKESILTIKTDKKKIKIICDSIKALFT